MSMEPPSTSTSIPTENISVSAIASASTDTSVSDSDQVHNYDTNITPTIDETNLTQQIDDNETEQPAIESANQQHQETVDATEESLNNKISKDCKEQTNGNSRNNQSSCALSVKTRSTATISSVSTDDETINILLLGESGVGKSTFINAFVNYITYESLNEAESKEPMALIPASFLITTGDDFTEKVVKLNVRDKFKNEKFDHPGQSATQRCRSYVFNLPHRGGRKLRIIDTPGFGDTRGLAQDDLNMQHILEYISNLTHLNAICFLLRPNVTRLHLFFRLCLTQLQDFLGPNLHQNIIFCFTNARSTFYTPGDTAPVLKNVLQSFSTTNLSFTKANTFCFDNESFRYLIARKNKISFNNEEIIDYSMSWSKSVKELNRLLDYICQNQTICRMSEHCQSIKHAQLLIIRMIRPILEAIRNVLRNIILCENDPKKRSLLISSKSISRPITICLSCKHKPNKTAGFWILPDCQNNIYDNNHVCFSALNQHIRRDYILEHNRNSGQAIERKELLDQLTLLTDASAIFANFLMHTSITSEPDLFLVGFSRMIDEEKYIYMQEKQNRNKRLSSELEQVAHKYKSRLNEVKHNEKYVELIVIYNLINNTQGIPEVRTQLDAIKGGQSRMMEQYEYDASDTNTNYTF